MLLTNEKNTHFGDKILDLLDGAKSVHIASGYIGLDAFRRAEPRLRRVVDAGGDVRIILGLGLFEGLSEKMVEALRDFDKYCRGKQTESGVKACAYQRFHGKLYVIERPDGSRLASVGSSNFSSTGFGEWWEGNLLIDDYQQIGEIDEYMRRLEQSNAIDIAAVDFPLKGRKRTTDKKLAASQAPVETYSGSLPEILGEPAFQIPIRVTEKSNLNLFLSKGRKSERTHPYDSSLPAHERRKIDVYKPRPWYEVEMTIKREHISPDLLAFLPDQTGPWEFTLVTENRRSYTANLKRKTSGSDDKRSLREVGLDFMTSSREDLGRILKGHLEGLGLLRYGEPVTDEILEEAAMTDMNFYELEKDVFLLRL